MAAAGVLLGLSRAPWWLAIGIGVAFEVAYSRAGLLIPAPGAFAHPGNDDWTHDVVDLAALMAGWAAVALLPEDPGAPVCLPTRPNPAGRGAVRRYRR